MSLDALSVPGDVLFCRETALKKEQCVDLHSGVSPWPLVDQHFSEHQLQCLYKTLTFLEESTCLLTFLDSVTHQDLWDYDLALVV